MYFRQFSHIEKMIHVECSNSNRLFILFLTPEKCWQYKWWKVLKNRSKRANFDSNEKWEFVEISHFCYKYIYKYITKWIRKTNGKSTASFLVYLMYINIYPFGPSFFFECCSHCWVDDCHRIQSLRIECKENELLLLLVILVLLFLSLFLVSHCAYNSSIALIAFTSTL